MAEKKITRKSAADLVKESTLSYERTASWEDQLSKGDAEYVAAIIEHLVLTPDASLAATARLLIEELGIKRSVQTVRITLREMIKNAQKESWLPS